MVTAESSGLVIEVDGRRPLSAGLIADLEGLCHLAEDRDEGNTVIVHVSGAPGPQPDGDLTVGLVSKWERALRRLERLRAVSIAVACGDCGGAALDALLATDYRIADVSVRLLMPAADLATWPGMAMYRLVRQAGAAAVRRTVLFGIPIGADDALAMHLIDELTGDTAGALVAAAELAGALPGTEVAIRRQLMLDALTVSFEDALGAHLAACDRVLRHASAGALR